MSQKGRKSNRTGTGALPGVVDQIYGSKSLTTQIQKRRQSKLREIPREPRRSRAKSSVSSNRSPTPPSRTSTSPSRTPTPPRRIPKSSSLTPTPPPRTPTPPCRTPTPPSRTPTPPPRTPIPPSRTPTPPSRTPTPPPRTPSPQIPCITQPKQTIQDIRIGETLTEIKMTPLWFEQEDQQEPLRNIVYPSSITDQRPFDSVARYRATIKKNNNFRKKAIESGANRAETVMIALDKFAQQFGGDLSFTSKRISFDRSAHRTACGIATLGSVHLLATNQIPTARFVFQTDLNYKEDLAKSLEIMENFTLSFATAIAEVLQCENSYVRILSIEKNDDDEGNAQVDFGITTPEQVSTEMLAHDLASYARSGFRNNRTLKCVKAGRYRCQWMPLLTYLQLQPEDFDAEHNFDYRKRGLMDGYRGGCPYYVPVGWYRHALSVSQKYEDSLWLGYTHTEGVWPVAFHGTHADVVSDIAKEGLSTDKIGRDDFREEAVQQAGSKFDKPGVYLTTRCNGGAHPWYTKSFSVYISEKKTERFRVVFQCRVKPGEFTVHQSSFISGDIWRVVDPAAVRPYGILIRKRKAPKRQGDQSESDNE